MNGNCIDNHLPKLISQLMMSMLRKNTESYKDVYPNFTTLALRFSDHICTVIESAINRLPEFRTFYLSIEKEKF